jgi:hypothetical protein
LRSQPARFADRLGPLALAFVIAFGLVRGAGAALSAQAGAPVRPDTAVAAPDTGLARHVARSAATAPRATTLVRADSLAASPATPRDSLALRAFADSLSRRAAADSVKARAMADSLSRQAVRDSVARADSLYKAAFYVPLGPGGAYPPFLPDSLRSAFPDTSIRLPGLGGAPFDTSLLSRDRTAGVQWSPRSPGLAVPLYLAGKGPFESLGPTRLTYLLDARQVQVTVDPAADVVHTSLQAADVSLSPTRDVPMEDYAKSLTALSFRRTWVSESRRRIANTPTDIQLKGKKGPLEFHAPITLPKPVQFFVGAGGPSLNVSGSERISISGTSNWDNQQSGTGVKPSLFPSLDMRQDLNIALNGQLGDKAHIDVNQNSVNVTPLSNRIGIHYIGDEDEVVKEFDLGNTSLSLPGTQYVSYSGQNDGLFGIKTSARLGATDLDFIASKQEGRSERKSFQGTAQQVERRIDDLNYVKGKYFFLQRPAEQLATNSQIQIGTVHVYVDDGIGSNDQGLRVGYAEMDPTQAPGATPRQPGAFDGLQELRDYQISLTYFGSRFPVLVLNSAISSSEMLAVTYQEKLADGSFRQVGTVPLCPVDPNAPCDSVRLKLLQVPIQYLPAGTDQVSYDTSSVTSPFYPTRDYEIKSFYDLQTANIDTKTLTLQVRRYDATVDDESNAAYKEGQQLYSYLQVMGVDLFRDTGNGAAADGPDQVVDNFTNASFLDPTTGILFFPDLRPFDPRLPGRSDARPEDAFFFESRLKAVPGVPGLRQRVFWPENAANPPGAVDAGISTTPPDLRANPNVYDKRNITNASNDRRYYIYASFSGQDYSGTIYLGQTNILEGSDVVAVNGVALVRNTDYTIDYQAGTVTLLTEHARSNRAALTIDYSFAPLFAQAGKTLIGSAVGYHGTSKSFGGAFIYQSTGEQNARPRLGEEPSRTLIGDLNTSFSLRPNFITRALDKLPFYSTTAESRIDVNGELGVSLPNPNTKNTVYLDDFEGNRDSYSAPMTRGFWKWPSRPLTLNGAAVDTVHADYTELVWYNPYNTVKAGDLNPRLTRDQGSQNLLTTLDFYIPKAPVSRPNPELWTGVTTTVDANGSDFSRMQYLEVWVNDWRDPDVRSNPNLKLHIDLGIVSEDQQRAPGVLPNGVFDTEDKNHDGKYDYYPPGQSLDLHEDGGGDGIPDELETEIYDLSTASDADKHGDDYGVATNDAGDRVDLSDNGKPMQRYDPYVYIKPTLSEKSKGTTDNGSRLYTEDLDGNQRLDTVNSYVTYTLPLGDQNTLDRFLISAAESLQVGGGNPVAPNNGWRRYRIPLDESDPAIRQVIQGGSLANVKHMRIWLEGIDQFEGNAAAVKTDPSVRGRQPLIELGAVDVVGNRWQIAAGDSLLTQSNGSVVARNVNNQDDQAIYDPPFHVSTQATVGGTQTQREQSLALEVTRLPLGSVAEIFKTETQPEDYTRYARLTFYTAQFGFADDDSARYFLRIGFDDQNYYEYSRPIRGAAPAPYRPTPWQTVTVSLSDFSELKFQRKAGAVSDTLNRGDERFVVFGSPTFTRVQQYALGVISTRSPGDSSAAYRVLHAMSGDVWIDDLRALDVDRATGAADRLTVTTQFADLFNMTTNWDHQDENFQRLGQTSGSDVNSNRLSLSGTFAPHKFITSTGILLPVTFNYAKSTSTPRLVTGTDVILTPDEAASQRSTTVDRGIGVTFSKTGDRSFIMRNTIDRLGLSLSFADRVAHSPTEVDSSRTIAGGGSYSLSPGDWLKIPIPGLKSHGTRTVFQPLPSNASISFNQQTQRSFTFKRGLEDPTGEYALQSDIYRKTSLYNLAATWRPLPLGTYTLSSTRDAAIPGVVPTRLLGINFGTMTNLTSRIDSRVSLRAIPVLQPSFDFGTSYGEQRTPDLSPDLSLGQFQNSTSMGLSMDLPFGRLAHGPVPTRPPSQGGRGIAADSTRRDTTAVRPPPSRGFSLPVGRLIARLGTVSLRGSFNRSTAFSRYYGEPSVPYKLGIARSADTQWNQKELPSIFPGPQSTENSQSTWSGDASSQVALFGKSTVRARANYTATAREYNGQTSATSSLTFPDLDIDWGSVHKLLGLGKIFPQLGARSRFSTVVSQEGQVLGSPTSNTKTSNWQPLLSLQGNTRGQAQVQLSIERTSSSRQDFATRRADRSEGQTTIRSSISRTYSPGQHVPLFGGGKAGLKSSLTLQADGAYTKRTGLTEAAGIASSKTNTDQLDINTSSTYAFSTYVNGTLGLGFTQSRDLQLRNPAGDPIKRRSIRLEASASFRF